MAKKETTPTFIQEFEIQMSESRDYREIDKVEDHARRLYNALLGEFRKRVKRANVRKNGKLPES